MGEFYQTKPGEQIPTCRHFTGVYPDKECAAGVLYKSVRDESGGPYKWPCLNKPDCLTTCDKRSLYTQAELDQQEVEIEAALNNFFGMLGAGICPECQMPATEVQRGSCVYARECGHRLYQGKIGAFSEKGEGVETPKFDT